MTWIDNKKTYDMRQQTWIIECLKIYQTFDNISYLTIFHLRRPGKLKSGNIWQYFISEDQENWRVELTVGEQTLAKVKIHQGVFQEDFAFITATH